MVMSILKFIKSEIKKVILYSADMILTFEDNISKQQYSFIKNCLNKYEWYINDEYSMNTETIYNESSGMLLIALDIIIPDRHMPKNTDNLTQMIKDHINKFPKFYKQNMKLYHPETGKN
jgi:hypothetical protein